MVVVLRVEAAKELYEYHKLSSYMQDTVLLYYIYSSKYICINQETFSQIQILEDIVLWYVAKFLSKIIILFQSPTYFISCAKCFLGIAQHESYKINRGILKSSQVIHR